MVNQEEQHSSATPTETIVAISLAGDSRMDVYVREGSSTHVQRQDFTPWLILNSAQRHLARNHRDIVPLAGKGYFNQLVLFDSWQAWRSCYRSIRDLDPQLALAFHNPVEQYMVLDGVYQLSGLEFDEITRAQLDIETTGLEPEASDAGILMIAVSLNGQHAEVFRADDMPEPDMIAALNDWIDRHDPDVIEGHNIFNFDIPYLVARSQVFRQSLTWGRDGSPLRQAGTRRFKAGARSIPFDAAYARGRHIIDTYQQIQRYDYGGTLNSYGLKEAIRELGLERADRQHVAGENISRVWQSDPQRLVHYAIDDLRDIDLLSRLSLPTEFYQARMLPSPLQDVAVGGPGEKVNDLLVRAYVAARQSIPAPGPARSYPGGYTEVRSVGRFAPVVKSDLESLYPAIMLADRIAPESDEMNVFLPLLLSLTSQRLDAKRGAAAATGYERARLNGVQSSLKVLINSFYGYLGYSRGYFNDFSAAERVTLRGHDIIGQVTDLLEEEGAEIIEIDTDGVYFQPPVSVTDEDAEMNMVEQVSDRLPDGINLAHDGRWKAMLSLKLKNYALLGYDDRLQLKGSSLRSRRDELFIRQFIQSAALIFLKGDAEENVRQLYLDVARRILDREMQPDEIARVETITEQTFRSASTRKLADALGSERIGERVAVYQRATGELARIALYDGDEDQQYLLRRLKAATERFRPLYTSDDRFEYDFPVITFRTDLQALAGAKRVDQMRLF